MSSIHSYPPVERSSAARSPVPELRHRPLGYLPLSARVAPLLVQGLSAHLQRSHPHVVGPDQALVGALDLGHLSLVSIVFIASHSPRVGHAYPNQLSLVLVVTEYGLVL